MSCHYSDWIAEAREIAFKLLRQRKRHLATPCISLPMIDISAGDHNAMWAIMPAGGMGGMDY